MTDGNCRICGSQLLAAGDGPAVCPRCLISGQGPVDRGNGAETVMAVSSRSSSTPPEVALAPAGAHYGPYVCLERLGAGGMGEVWKAWDGSLRRWVALKLLKGGSGEEIERFRREAHVAARLSHPNIAAIYGVGEERGRHYIAMQYVDGSTMRGLDRGDHAALAQAIRDAALALSYAHAQGLVHRDIKPDNLMVTPPRTTAIRAGDSSAAAAAHVFVMDFGLARAARADSKITASGEVLGTPSYMSPEQAAGENVDARTDIWSLGATLYDLLTGTPPFTGASIHEILAKIAVDDPVSPRKRNREIDGDLETIVLKCLEKEPSRRYATATDLANDLERWMHGEPVAARRPSLLRRLRRTASRHRAAVRGAAVALGLLTVVLLGVRLGPKWKEQITRAGRLRQSAALLEEAARLLDAGNFAGARDKAVELIDQAGQETGHPRAEARRIQGEALVRLGNRDAAREAFGRSFIEAAYSSSNDDRLAGAASLVRLAELNAQSQGPGAALAACQAAIARFPDSPHVEFLLCEEARLFEELDEPETAAARWRELASRPFKDHALGARVRQAEEFWSALLPMKEVESPPGRMAAMDLDGDGTIEIVINEEAGYLSTHALSESGLELRLRSKGPRTTGLWTTAPLQADADGDGSREILVARGHPAKLQGSLEIWKVAKDAISLVAATSLPSPASVIRVDDLDADGRPEIVVGLDHPGRLLRIYRLTPTRRLVLEVETTVARRSGSSADILDVLTGDFHPAAGREMLVSAGPWGGWQTSLLQYRPGKRWFSRLHKNPDWMRAACFERVGENQVAFLSAWIPSETKALRGRDLLPEGIYVARTGATGLEDLRRLAAPGPAEGTVFYHQTADTMILIRLAGRDWLAATERGDTATEGYRFRARLHSLDGAGEHRTLDVSSMAWIAAAELDGDPDSEVVVAMPDRGRQFLRVYGIRDSRAHHTPAPRTRAAGASVRGDLVAMGLEQLLEDVHLENRDWAVEARARIQKEKWDEAIDLLQQAEPSVRRDLLRAMSARQVASADWSAVVRCCDAMLRDRGHDPSETAAIRRSRTAAQAASKMVPRPIPGFGGETTPPPLVVPLPLHARWLDGTLQCTVNSAGPDRAGAGIPFEFSGGPFQISWEMRFQTAGFATRLSAGISGPASLALNLSVHGSANESARPLHITWNSPEATTDVMIHEDFSPDPEAWYSVTIEYVPGFETVTASVRGLKIDRRIQFVAPASLRHGHYTFGAVFGYDWGGYEGVSRFSLRNLSVRSFLPATTCLPESPSREAMSRLDAANGHFARGEHEKGLSLCRELLAQPEAVFGPVACEGHFSCGLMLLRLGRASEAIEEFRRSRDADPEEDCKNFRNLARSSVSELTPAEAGILGSVTR
jgi:tetratricopeptide (TPR) repeat protein